MPFHTGDEDSAAVSTPATAQKALPKPERPFCTDDGASLLVPKLKEKGHQNITLEYNSVEDVFTHFASDLESQGSPMTPSLAFGKAIEPSSPDMQSYVSRLKGQIDEVLAHKSRETTLVNGDGSVPLESQERAWGDVLSMYEYPDKPDSQMDPEKWAFWAADFLQPNSTQPSPLIRELGMNIKYFAGTSIRYQYKLFRCGSDTSALVQEYKEGIALIERMPGSPWAQLKPQEWERLAIDFIRRLGAKYNVSFANSTGTFEEDTSTAIKPKSQEVRHGPSASSQHNVTSVTSLLDSLKQRLAKITEERAYANKCGLDTSALEFASKGLQYLIENSPLELTSQLGPDEWEPMAFHATTDAIEPPLRDQPQKPNVTRDSTEKPSTACSPPTGDKMQTYLSRAAELMRTGKTFPEKERPAAFLSFVQKNLQEMEFYESTGDCSKPPSPTEHAAQEHTSSSDPGSDEERAIIPPSPVITGRKSPSEAPAMSSVSISSPAEPVGLMVTCRYSATSELSKFDQEKQKKDVEGLQKTETDLGRGEGVGRKIAQEKTEGNCDEQVSRQSETVIVGQSSEVDETFVTDARAMDRTNKKEGEHKCDGTHDRKLQAMQAVGPDCDPTADRKLKDVTVEKPNEQKQVAHKEYGHTTLIDPGALAQDQLTQCTGPNAKMERERDVSPRAEQKQIDDTDESNEQPRKQVDIREEPAESTSENKDPATTPEDPEKPAHERRVFSALELEISDVKSDLETTDAKKDAITALEHKEGSIQEGEASTSPSLGALSTPPSSDAHSTPPRSDAKKDAITAFEHKDGSTHAEEVSTSPSLGALSTPPSSDAHSTPPRSEAHSSPTYSEAPDIEDNTKSRAKVSQAEESPLATRSCGPSMGGKKTYAALAKEPASGSGSGGGKQTESKSDPWAVPVGEPTWGRGKG